MAATVCASIVWIILTLLGLTTSDQGEAQLNSTLRFVAEAEDVIAIKNEPLWLPCLVAGPAEGGARNVTWYRDGEVVPAGERTARLTILPNGTLHIARVLHKLQKQRSDQGQYRCLVRDSVGTVFSRTAKVQVAALPRFSVDPEPVTVVSGQLARLQCRISGVPTPTITWERNKLPLPQNDRYVALASGVLQISNVSVPDQALYRCTAVNVAKERHSAEALLTVAPPDGSISVVPPSLLAGPQDQIVVSGQSTTLECCISGLPQPTVIWTRLNGDLLPQNRHSIVGAGNLRLERVESSDEGVYICSVGTIMSQASLRIIERPRLTSQPESLAQPSTLSTVRIRCGFTGSQPLVITWYKDGRPLRDNGRITLREDAALLIVLNPDPDDSGYYQCVGENQAGTASQVSRLLIYPTEDAPGAPYNLVAQQHSSTSIYLTWDAPEPKAGHNIVAYSVHYKYQGGMELQKVLKERTVQISQLLPHTNYTFYVVAYNAEGASIHSDKVTQITDDDVPKVAPDISVTPLGASSLLVQWAAISSTLARGHISAYRVVYRLSGNALAEVREIPGSDLEYTITDLEPDQRYDVRVLAGTRKGFPELEDKDWPWVSQVTNPNNNNGYPGVPDMHTAVVNSTAIHVSWREPGIVGTEATPGEEVLGYKMIFFCEGEARRTIILVPEDRNKTLTRLKPDSWYEIALMAFNILGDGDMAVRKVKTLPAQLSPPDRHGSPPPPRSVDAAPVDAASVRVSWAVPPYQGPLQYYSIRYIPVTVAADGTQIPDYARTRELTSSQTSVLVEGLLPFHHYLFSVRSHVSRSVYGPFSDTVQCQTKEGRPSAPRNPVGKVQSPQVVELSWQPPAESNGVIVKYVIFYSVDNSSPDVTWARNYENGSSTHTLVHNLHSDEDYFFKLRAATVAGEGPSTEIIAIHTARRSAGYDARQPHPLLTSDRDMGIIVGVCIGGGCIIICALIVLLRNRCFPPRPLPVDPPTPCPNGCIVNGNKVYLGNVPHLLNHCNVHELDSFSPMLTHIPENEHSDSKGGTYIRVNGRFNGMLVNGGGHPNGRCKSYIIHDHSFLETGGDDCPQLPLRSYPLHHPGEPLTVALSSLEDIDRSYTHEGHLKASPSSSGVTDCTAGAGDCPTSSNSSQSASLERHRHRPSRSPHSTLSSTSSLGHHEPISSAGHGPGRPTERGHRSASPGHRTASPGHRAAPHRHCMVLPTAQSWSPAEPRDC